MIYPKNQNWRTTLLPWGLSLANAVNTGVSFTTPSGTIANQQAWASAGFRGLGPTLTFPGGSGLDGMGCGCGCGGGGNDLLMLGLVGLGVYLLCKGGMRRSYGD